MEYPEGLCQDAHTAVRVPGPGDGIPELIDACGGGEGVGQLPSFDDGFRFHSACWARRFRVSNCLDREGGVGSGSKVAFWDSEKRLSVKK